MTKSERNVPERERVLMEHINLYEDGATPDYLYNDYTGPTPLEVFRNPPKPHNWFWRNHWKVGGLMVLGSLGWAAVPIFFPEFGRTVQFQQLFLSVGLPIELVGASLLLLRSVFSPPSRTCLEEDRAVHEIARQSSDHRRERSSDPAAP
jgi:hypothetical protein